jgi:hypothetical protein
MGYNKAMFSIVGHRNLEKIFRNYPEQYNSVVRRAFQRAAKPVKKEIIRRLPDNMKVLQKAVKIKVSRRHLVASVGVYSGAGVYINRRGVAWDPWALAYWFNYGTYANRSQFHRFQNARRGKSRWRTGGIKPDYFIEEAWDASSRNAQSEFEKTWEQGVDKFLEKYALK